MNPKEFEKEFFDTFGDLEELLRVSGIKSRRFKIEDDDDEDEDTEPLNPFETAEEPETYDFNSIIKEMTEIAESMDEVPSAFVLKWAKDLANAR